MILSVVLVYDKQMMICHKTKIMAIANERQKIVTFLYQKENVHDFINASYQQIAMDTKKIHDYSGLKGLKSRQIITKSAHVMQHFLQP